MCRAGTLFQVHLQKGFNRRNKHSWISVSRSIQGKQSDVLLLFRREWSSRAARPFGRCGGEWKVGMKWCEVNEKGIDTTTSKLQISSSTTEIFPGSTKWRNWLALSKVQSFMSISLVLINILLLWPQLMSSVISCPFWCLVISVTKTIIKVVFSSTNSGIY